MNEKLENNKDKPAYIRYDKTFGSILEVTLHNKLSTNDSVAILLIHRTVALEFLNGKKKIYDYAVSYDSDGHLAVLEKQYGQELRSFWELVDITSKICPLEIIDITFKHFTLKSRIYVIPENLVLYVTEKNDPNLLYYTIRLKEYLQNTDRTWTIPITLDDYSIYVSGDVTRSE
jgi:RNAse (barnase) inhibitor barstar